MPAAVGEDTVLLTDPVAGQGQTLQSVSDAPPPAPGRDEEEADSSRESAVFVAPCAWLHRAEPPPVTWQCSVQLPVERWSLGGSYAI